MDWIEIVGYVGSALVALSLTMNNIWRLRWVNLVGAAIFTVYGVMIQSYPIVLLNGFITAADIYYLYKMSHNEEYFSILYVPRGNVFLLKFVEFYQDDIQQFAPDFTLEALPGCKFVFILRNLVPAGLFVYELKEAGQVFVHLDYVVPDYRDLKNARYLFSTKSRDLRNKGYTTYITRSKVKSHQAYLVKMGFQPVKQDSTLFNKPI